MGCFESFENKPEKKIREAEHVMGFNRHSIGDFQSGFWNKNNGRYITIDSVQTALSEIQWYKESLKDYDINGVGGAIPEELSEVIDAGTDASIANLAKKIVRKFLRTVWADDIKTYVDAFENEITDAWTDYVTPWKTITADIPKPTKAANKAFKERVLLAISELEKITKSEDDRAPPKELSFSMKFDGGFAGWLAGIKTHLGLEVTDDVIKRQERLDAAFVAFSDLFVICKCTRFNYIPLITILLFNSNDTMAKKFEAFKSLFDRGKNAENEIEADKFGHFFTFWKARLLDLISYSCEFGFSTAKLRKQNLAIAERSIDLFLKQIYAALFKNKKTVTYPNIRIFI